MDLTLKNLVEAEQKAQQLFNEIENKNILIAGNSENKINELIFELAFNMFGIKKYWHKRIVRCGENTLYPYNENPENLILKKEKQQKREQQQKEQAQVLIQASENKNDQ